MSPIFNHHALHGLPTNALEHLREALRNALGNADLQEHERAKGLFQAAKAMFRDVWDARLAMADDATKALKKDVQKIERQIETMLDRIVESSTSSVVTAYEKRISKLEAEKILIEEQVAKSGKPLHTLEESFELALKFLSSPWNIWKNNSLAWQRTVLRLAFAEPVRYCRNRGVRTPKISLPFKVLGDISTAKCGMARFDGVCSNDLFDTLDEWERYLRSVEFPNTVTQDNDPGCGDEHFGT